MRTFLIVFVLFVVVSLVGLGAFTGLQLLGPFVPNSPDKKIILIDKGTPPRKIAKDLQDAGIIRNAELFFWYGRLKKEWPKIKYGEYELGPAQSAKEVFAKLASGLGYQRALLVKEGSNMYEIANAYAETKIGTREQFLKRVTDPIFISSLNLPVSPLPKSLEGYLYPNTYYYTRASTLDDVIRGMVRNFENAYAEILAPAVGKTTLTGEQLVILASMVEKETGAPEERPLIAGVFYNRLKKGMRLQSDPTTIYGIWTRYKGNLHKSDLLEYSPYNTYTIVALPVGPISNPGREAMLAVATPAMHEFLYFVSKNDGTHLFSKTYEEHLKAVAAFQLNAAARAGKSWRDLSKTRAAKGLKGTR